MRVVVLEAGIDYVEQLESFDLDGVSGPQALDGALAAVAAKGYQHYAGNSEGGSLSGRPNASTAPDIVSEGSIG